MSIAPRIYAKLKVYISSISCIFLKTINIYVEIVRETIKKLGIL